MGANAGSGLRMRSRIAGLALGAALLAGAGGSPAQQSEPTPDIVNERDDEMTGMATAMKAISQRIESGSELAGIRDLALRIRGVALRIPELFPPGSNKGQTNATAAIWERRPEFEDRAKALERESRKLAEAAATLNRQEIADQFRAVGRVCASCHETFRKKKE